MDTLAIAESRDKTACHRHRISVEVSASTSDRTTSSLKSSSGLAVHSSISMSSSVAHTLPVPLNQFQYFGNVTNVVLNSHTSNTPDYK